MADRVNVSSAVLRWARSRSGRTPSDLKRFPIEEWEAGTTAQPTIRQLEEYAKATRTPIGFLFLEEPPAPERVPIPDFRRFGGDTHVHTPTPDLLDTIYACQERHDWYRDFAAGGQRQLSSRRGGYLSGGGRLLPRRPGSVAWVHRGDAREAGSGVHQEDHSSRMA
jgi:hypothetical protein